MTGGPDEVRRLAEAVEPVSLPEGFVPAGPPPDAEAPPDQAAIDWAAVERAAAEPENDLGNGRRLAIHHGRDLLWVPRVGWHVWDGCVWRLDPAWPGVDFGTQVRQRAQSLSRLVAAEAAFLLPRAPDGRPLRRAEAEAELAALPPRLVPGSPEAERARALALGLKRHDRRVTFARSAGNTAAIEHAVTEAGVALSAPVETVDADPLAAACLSGVLRFSVETSGGLRRASVTLAPHDRADRITKLMPAAWEPDAQAPRFRSFLARIMPDVEVQGFLQRVFGLCLLGRTEPMLCYFYGDGANGKSRLLQLIASVLGDYAASARIESVTGSNRRGGGDATPDLVPLIGARLVRMSEPGADVVWQEGLIKELTGGEPLLIRALHQDFVSVRLNAKFVVSGNHKPEFRGTDDGIWRRVKLVPFLEQIPEAERLPEAELDALLFSEAPGVLQWMAEGALAYLEGGLMEPAAVADATRQLREESDPYGAFLDEACVVSGDPRDTLRALELVEAFGFWLAARGEGQFKDRTVARALKDHARRWRSRRTGQRFAELKSGGVMHYTGLRFTELFARQLAEAPRDARSGRPVPSRDAAAAPAGPAFEADLW